ncbi:MAG: hypothetical protein ACLR0U_23445 [Enterocloster clostridioformis]
MPMDVHGFQKNLGIQVLASVFEAQVLERGLLETLGLNADNENYRQFAAMRRCQVDRIIEDNEMIRVGTLEVRALLTPGTCSRVH